VDDRFLDGSFRAGTGVQEQALHEAAAQKVLGIVVTTETVAKGGK
jgi:hypothetical protein